MRIHSRLTVPVVLACIMLLVGGGRVLPVDSTANLKRFERYALTHSGDEDRGRELFGREEVTRCKVCHRVGDQGGQVGPDLSVIAGKFDRPHLIESLLQPSQQIVEGFRSSVIVLKDGRTLTGIIKERSDQQIILIDANNKSQTIVVAEIEERVDSHVSLMPEGLAKDLSPSEFTDLIAYLETLRPGGKPKHGSDLVGPISIPDGFQVSIVTTGLDAATAMEVLPDGRVLVCEQTASVRVIENDKLLDEPLVTLPVDSSWERGVIGVTIDPSFPQKPFVYVCWVAKQPYPHHRVSRFRVEGNIAVPRSEKVLLVGDDQTKMGGKVPNGHQGGALHFGPDGCLYVSIGEQTAGEPAQSLKTFLGKILRINPDGSIPDDNLLMDQTFGKYRAIWAYGCRNPFTFAIRNTDGLMMINDVGGKFEEINLGKAGANYGWPTVDHGPWEGDSRFVGPVHWYPQSSIAGGDFSPGPGADRSRANAWPEHFENRYFFADFVHGWIRILDPHDPQEVTEFAAGLRRPVDLRFAKDGSLYVLLRNAWVIDDKFQAGTGSLLRICYQGHDHATARDSDSDQKQESRALSPPSISSGSTAVGVKLTRDAIDQSADALPAFRIDTPTATYYLEKSGAGLSSLIDRDGNDWLSFHPQRGSQAAGEYRGFPNAVHKQSGNFFHPQNSGTQPSWVNVVDDSSNHVSIVAESENKLWACRYDFFVDHATFTMTRMPHDRRYWVLYEGTPGGQFDDDDWWMTSSVSSPQPMTRSQDEDIPNPEWIAFGDKRLMRSLLLLHHNDDDHPDRFYQMQHKMTVFGFGRARGDKYLDSVPQHFTISFVESNEHAAISAEANRLLRLPRADQ